MLLALFALPASASAKLQLVLPVTDRPSDAERDASGFNHSLLGFDPASGKFSTIARGGGDAIEVRDPAWSPNGESLVHVRTRLVAGRRGSTARTRQDELWLSASDGGDRRKLFSGTAIGPAAFSPNGRRLAFMTRYPSRSGEGCGRGGVALTVIDLRSRKVLRASRCSSKLRAGGRAIFIGGNSRIAFAIDRSLAEAHADGHDADQRSFTRLVRFADRATHTLLGPAGPQGLWVGNALGDNLIRNWAARSTRRLSDFDFAVSPDGRTSAGACGELAQSGICWRDVRGGASTKIPSPFTADIGRDSLEFGFSFDRSSKQLATFAYPASGGPSATVAQSLCLRAALDVAAPVCIALPAGQRVIERSGAIAVWRP